MHLSDLCTKVLLFFEIPKSFVEKNQIYRLFLPQILYMSNFFCNFADENKVVFANN